MRNHRYRAEPALPQRGSVMEDVYSRLWGVLAATPFNLSVRQIVDGEVLKTTVTLDLATLKHTGRRINIEEETN